MLAGGDRPLRILQIKQEDKSFAKISSKDQNSINGESSFRVNYYNAVSGAVPFTWETRPGTPKHAFSEVSLPPLTPPPSYLFKQKSTNSGMKNPKSKIFNSIFPRLSFREEKLRTHEGGSLSSSSVSSSSLSSSFSASSTPRDLHISCRNNGNRRSRSLVNFGLDEDEDKDEMSPAAGSTTSCFGGTGRGYRSSGEGKLRMYRPMKNVKNTLLSFVGGRGTA